MDKASGIYTPAFEGGRVTIIEKIINAVPESGELIPAVVIVLLVLSCFKLEVRK